MRILRFSLLAATFDEKQFLKSTAQLHRLTEQQQRIHSKRHSNGDLSDVSSGDSKNGLKCDSNVDTTTRNRPRIALKVDGRNLIELNGERQANCTQTAANKRSATRLKNVQQQTNGHDESVRNEFNVYQTKSNGDDLPRLPRRLGQHRKHKQRKKPKFNKRSSILVSTLSNPLDATSYLESGLDDRPNVVNNVNSQNDVNRVHLSAPNDRNSRHMNHYANLVDQSNDDKNQTIKLNNKFYLLNKTGRSRPNALTNSLISLHRKVKRRKTIHNQYSPSALGTSKLRRPNLNEQVSYDKRSSRTHLHSSLNQSKLNTFAKLTLLLTPSSTPSSTYRTQLIDSTVQLNASHLAALDAAQSTQSNAVQSTISTTLNATLLNTFKPNASKSTSFNRPSLEQTKLNSTTHLADDLSDQLNDIYRRSDLNFDQNSKLPLNELNNDFESFEHFEHFQNLDNFRALPLRAASNETIDYLTDLHTNDLRTNTVSKYDLNSLNQVTFDKTGSGNKTTELSGELEQSVQYAKNLMVIIYFIILLSVLILLLRVLYIAIVRKLRLRPTASQSANSARQNSSQLYTQNLFNPTHLSYQPGGTNSNSNVNVSTYGGRSEANSISGGTASFIGSALTGGAALIAHNVTRTGEQPDKSMMKRADLDHNTKRRSFEQSIDGSANLSANIRPFSRQSGKFTDLNIISDDFSSSVYVNEDDSNQ